MCLREQEGVYVCGGLLPLITPLLVLGLHLDLNCTWMIPDCMLHRCEATAVTKICPETDRQTDKWLSVVVATTKGVSRTTFWHDDKDTQEKHPQLMLSQLVTTVWCVLKQNYCFWICRCFWCGLFLSQYCLFELFFVCDFVNSLENIITLWAWVTPLLQMSRFLFLKTCATVSKNAPEQWGKSCNYKSVWVAALHWYYERFLSLCVVSPGTCSSKIWCFCSEDSRGENDLRGENIVRETTREDRASEQQLLIEVFDPGHAAV